jgi:hypothetical protein
MINIYGYSYPSAIKEFKDQGFILAKIGDSHREVDIRLSEQGGAAEWEGKVKIGEWVNLQNISRDYELHYVLTERGLWHKTDGAGNEWFRIPATTVEEAHAYINTLVTDLEGGNVSPPYQLREHQSRTADSLIDIINKKGLDVTVLEEQAPRSGKTLTNCHSFLELNKHFGINLMLIPVYWLSALTSYKNEIKRWRQLHDISFFDTVTDGNWSSDAQQLLSQGKKVCLGISTHASESWFEKYRWINEYSNPAFVVSEEADFGSHTEDTLEKYKFLIANKPTVKVITSGTNIHRMAKIGGVKIDALINVLYSELESSEDPTIVKRQYVKMTVPSMLHDYIENIDDRLIPTWSKLNEKPMQNQEFLRKFYRGLLSYDPEWGNSIDQLAGKEINVVRVRVSATKKAMDQLALVLDKACPEHLFAVLHGDVTDNRDAESYAKKLIHEVNLGFHGDKSKIVFLVNMMGSRSWSVGDVEAVVSCTDGGDLGAFIQEGSRCLSPKDNKNKGWIIDCAFDQNRTSQTELAIMHEASQYAVKNETNLVTAVRFMFNNISLTSCDDFGMSLLSVNDLMADWEDNDKILDIADNATDYQSLIEDPKAIDILRRCQLIARSDRAKLETLIPKGKTYGTRGESENVEQDQEAIKFKKLILGAIRSINSSATTVYDFANGGETFEEALNMIISNKVLNVNFTEMYKISANDVLYLLKENYLPKTLLDLVVHNSSIERV